METGVETQKPVELRKPQKIERFEVRHFDYLMDHILKDWRRAEVPGILTKAEFRAERSLPNGDHLDLAINTHSKFVTLMHRPRGANYSNMIALKRLRTFELLGGVQVRFENDDQHYLIGTSGNWHYVEDKKVPSGDRLRVELQF